VSDAASRFIALPKVSATDWQSWLEERVPVQTQPLVDPARRLVVVAPHPDDEVLACALLMQQHSSLGGALHVVAVTDGEASHTQAQWPMDDLQQRRTRERREGLARLGLQDVPVTPLHLPDGGVAEAGSRLHAALLALLTPQDAIVSTWWLDGHPDHECCGRVAQDVARLLRLPLLQAPVWMWHWAQPGLATVPWHTLRAIDVSARMRACKAAALHAHQSQLTARAPEQPPVLDDTIVARALWPYEYFFADGC